MSVHAFVDESYRDGRYLLVAAVIDPGDLRRLRSMMRGLLFPGQRELHCQREKEPRRRFLVDQLVTADVRALVYAAGCTPRGQETGRQACLAQLATDLMARRAPRLVIDSRGDRDQHDVRTLQRVLAPHPSSTHLVYEHTYSQLEPLIWAADLVGWAYGAGGDWRRRITPTIIQVINCPPQDSAKPGRRPSGR